MSSAILPTRLADLARGDLASLRAFLSGRRTRGTSLAAQLDARHDTERQDTLLTWAARHGQAEAVRLLLEGGASVGATNDDGASALYIACQEGQIERARLLVEAGDVDWANHANNVDNAIGSVFSGDEAFRVVMDWVDENDAWAYTAVIVTADHGHYLVIEDADRFVEAGKQAEMGQKQQTLVPEFITP